ncbi:hypothetical protein SNE40_018624 [Patella caerulea]|uniref:Uncharacterized protein n=1 Tax=Patella caerulea TaxID=87958 RepID=A0AAN8PGV6_PATCE
MTFLGLSLCVSVLCSTISLVLLTPTPYPTPKPVKIEMKCTPDNKFADCPQGYCCVRDEFLPTYVYCKRFGQSGDACTTQDYTHASCPCAAGYGCKPKIISDGVPFVFGTCTKDYNVVG